MGYIPMTKCPKCGSSDVKKRPFTASGCAAIFCIVFGVWGLVEMGQMVVRPDSDPFRVAYYLFLPAIFFLAGIVALVRKRYRCQQCKNVFNA